MSFILDALKKSETDRQRQNGPALFEVRAAPPRDKLPVWAVGLGVLLAINLVIVAWVLLRRPASADAAAQSAATQQTGQGVNGPGAMAGSQGQQSGQGAFGPGGVAQGQQGWGAQGQGPAGWAPGQGQGMQAQGQQAPGGVQQGAAMSQGGPGGYAGAGPGGGGPVGGFGAQGNGAGQTGYAPASGTQPAGPMAQTAGLTAGQQPGMTGQQAPANGQAYAGTQQPGATGSAQGGEKLNPDDYAPAADPVPQPFGNHVTRSTSSGVPLYNDVSATTALPSLRLDLHVYAATPQERFVMINMHKLHEGDLMTAEGVRVESITPYGAVLSRNGTKFLLPRD